MPSAHHRCTISSRRASLNCWVENTVICLQLRRVNGRHPHIVYALKSSMSPEGDLHLVEELAQCDMFDQMQEQPSEHFEENHSFREWMLQCAHCKLMRLLAEDHRRVWVFTSLPLSFGVVALGSLAPPVSAPIMPLCSCRLLPQKRSRAPRYKA
jgi:hypothetical protein